MFFGITIIIILGFIYSVFAGTELGTVSLQITGRGIRHGTPTNINLGTVTASGSTMELTGQFTEPFRVEDLEGYNTGHYTTIQCDGIYGPYNYVLSGVYLKAGNTSPALLMGLTGDHVLINSGLSADYMNIIDPVTYIYKETHPDNGGLINTYGDMPFFKIIIPPDAPRGTYSGTIVFSFYMY